MTSWKRNASMAAIMIVAATGLAGCSTFGDDSGEINTISAPQQAQPVESSSVATTALPPLPGQTTETTGMASADTTVMNPATGMAAGTADVGTSTADPGLTGPISNSHGTGSDTSFVSLNDVGAVPNGPGRNLSGGLTVEKLLGGWTVVSGQTQCRLNLTYTAKTGTSRYRASSPGCQLSELAPVASWQLAGTQVQLFNGKGKLIGTLLLSGNQFIGTLAGGRGISMAG